MFKEVCTLISTLTGFPIGGKLQAGHETQNAPPRCVVITETGGPAEFYPNTDLVEYGIQALCRAESYGAASDDAWAVHKALHGECNWDMPGQDGGPDLLAMTIEAVATPQYLGEDDNRRHLFAINFTLRIEEGSCGSI
jgi:hypothetical protein